MKQIGYYSYKDTGSETSIWCSKESDDQELVVNCAGCFTTSTPFTTDLKKGRMDYYLMYILSGSLSICFNDNVLVANKNKLVVFDAKKPYKYFYSGGEELKYLWVHFTGSKVLELLKFYNVPPAEKIYDISSYNTISNRFQSIFDAYSYQDDYRDRELSNLLERLLISIGRSSTRISTQTSSLDNSLKYIGSYYNTQIKVPDLAKLENLSVSRYNFLFKEVTGYSPTKYIMDLRISCAKDLIESTDIQIKKIGEMCGYIDSHFFSKIFKQKVGVSPQEYRNGLRKL